MIVPKTKIADVCPKDKSRPVLNHVHFNADKGQLEACDGFILAILPVESEPGEPDALIPMEAMKQAQKLARRKSQRPALDVRNSTENTVTACAVPAGPATPESERVTGGTYPLYDGRYPECNQIVPRLDTLEYLCTLDAKRLLQLAQGICEKGILSVSLYQAPGDGFSPIFVEPQEVSTYVKPSFGSFQDQTYTPSTDKAHGVIMPMYRAGR